jgi:pimeloyl-ACP methyl ester carboxylesterase
MQVYAVDLPGFGASDAPRGAVTVSFYADFLRKFIGELGLKSPTVAGISMGGQIALATAIYYPESVSRLILLGSAGLSTEASGWKFHYLFTRSPKATQGLLRFLGKRQKIFKTFLRGMFFDHSKMTDDLVVSVLTEFRNSHAIETISKFAHSELTHQGMRSDFSGYLAELKQPTMLIHGQFDLAIPALLSQQASQIIPSCDLRIVPKCGHWITRERPETVTAFIEEFTK